MAESKLTILEAAITVLKALKRPAPLSEIYAMILEQDLYQFNTPTPEHVLRTTIRRHASNVDRIDSNDAIHFEMVDTDVYALASGERVLSRKRMGSGMKRIMRAKDKEDIISLLTSDQVGIFKEIWKLLLFSAQVGMKNGAREELKQVDSGKGIDQATFANSPAWPGVLYLMSLVETNKTGCLSGGPEADDERVAIFQEYANGGLTILKDFFAGRSADLDGMLAFIDSQNEDFSGKPDLDISI